MSLLPLEDRVTPSSTIGFSLSSPTVAASTSTAIALGTLTDTFVGGGNLTNSSISVNWGDGHTDHNATVSPIPPDSTTYSISDTHAYAHAGSFTVTVTDSDTHAVASAATTVIATPVVPTSGIAFNLASSTVPVSTSATGTSVSLGTFTDTNVAAGDLSNTSISIDWGDGTAATSGAAVATLPPSTTYYILGGTAFGTSQVHNYATAGPYTVTVTVNDGVNSDSASTTITATAPVTTNGIGFNLLSPTIALTNSAAINLGTVTDTNVADGSLASSAVTVDWGDGHTDTSATVSQTSNSTYSIFDSHTYAHKGNFTVTVTVDDGVHSRSASSPINVVVLAANTVSFDLVSPEVPVNSTSTTDTLGTFSDTNSGGYTAATVDWGDGSASTTAALTALPNLPSSYTVGLNHKYQTFGNFTATVTVTDGTGTFTASTPVTVYSTALLISPSSVSGSPGASAALTATLNDPGSTLASSQYQATVDWGDGTPGNPDVRVATVTGSNGVYTIDASHTYASVGTFAVQLMATRAGSLPFSTASAYTTATIARIITPTDWMNQLPDSIALTNLSIPGTHQSAAGGSVLAVLIGDEDLLSKAEKAQHDATIGDVTAFTADTIALAGGELVPPLVGIAAAADAAASILDGLASSAWSDYKDSLGPNAYPGLYDDAHTLEAFGATLSAVNGLSAGLHTASAIADAVAEGEGEVNPFADALQAIADTASASEDAAKLADYALFFTGFVFDAAGFNGEDQFKTDLEAAREKAAKSQTQELSIADQLNSGIRSLDIRGGTLLNNQIEIYNGTQDTGITLKGVLNDATAFLQAHSSETIVISLRSNENGAVDATTFNTELSSLLSSNDAAVSGTHTYNDFVYSSTSPTTTPDLGQVRGKIVIIPYAPDSTSAQTGSSFGWQPTIVDQNTSGVSDPVTLWNDAEGQNQTAGLIPTDLGNPSTLYINNLASESPGSPPIEEAASVNPIATQCFGSALLTDANYFHFARTTGVVGMDNPDQTLINDIIGENNLPIVVTSDLDTGAGSLRDAITLANSQPGVNTIEFSNAMTGPSAQMIVLQSDLPAITNDVDIVGSAYIEGNHHHVFQNSAQHTVTEVNFVASAGGTVATPITPSPSVPLYVNISGLTIFDHVAFTTAPQTLVAGVVSNLMDLQLQDAQNAPVLVATGASPLVLNLATTSTPTPFAHAEFRDATGITPITSESFTAGNSSTPAFTYYDEVRGKPTLTATVGTVPVATQTEKVNASAPVSITFVRQPASVYANTSIAPSVQLMDKFHNFVAFIPVTLRLNPVSVPAMRTGSIPVLRGTHTVKTPDTLNALASFPTLNVNLPGIYTLTATITVNGKKLSATSKRFTILANPNTVIGKVR